MKGYWKWTWVIGCAFIGVVTGLPEHPGAGLGFAVVIDEVLAQRQRVILPVAMDVHDKLPLNPAEAILEHTPRARLTREVVL